ncbi:helix-turn-helix domain-containing protein [Chroococcidiopsis sp. CCMEE 29]
MNPQYIQRIEYNKIKSIPFETLDKLCSALPTWRLAGVGS